MTLRRFLLWLLALLVAVSLAGAWYARNAWEEWQRLNNIREFQWQGLAVSLAGVELERFAVTQSQNGEPYRIEGQGLSLGWSWHWHGPLPDVVRVSQLQVDIPAWPGSAGQQDKPSAPAIPNTLPDTLPAWLPENITVERLVLTLPQAIRAEGDLALSNLSEPGNREITTTHMRLQGPLPETTLAGWQLGSGQADLVIAGRADEQSATLTLADTTNIELAKLRAPDGMTQLDNLRVNLAGVQLVAGYGLGPPALESLAVEGPVLAATTSLRHPQLLPQSWRLDTRLNGGLEDFDLEGEVSSSAGARATVDFRFPFQGIPELDLAMVSSGAKGARALAETFVAWPGDLEIAEGSVSADLGLRFPPEGTRLQGTISFDNLGGVFQRMAWTGAQGSLGLELGADRLAAQTSGLTLDSINPGIALRDIRVTGNYRSTLQRMAGGTLTLDRASAELLGGDVRVEPGAWQLSDLPLRVPLELTGIELAELMKVYPAEGLEGSGKLEGTVPLRIDSAGVSIDSGNIQALAPGGTLKLPAERLRAMARDNEAMSLVVQAMENFNYSVLNSTVDYDQDGTLVLGLRLEGSSPEVRDGHPIVLNINLEEDIPALLTSLQLSGRVNEAVTEKVRELLQKEQNL